MKTLSTPLPVTPDSVIDSVYNEQTANYRPKKKPHKKKSAYKHPSRSDGKAWDTKFRLYESRWLCTSIEHKKYMKEYLNRAYRRKTKQEKPDAKVDDET